METTNSFQSSVTYYQLTLCRIMCQEHICKKNLSRKSSGSLIGPSSSLQNTRVSDRITLFYRLLFVCFRLPSFAFVCLRSPSLAFVLYLYTIPFPHYPPSRLMFRYYFRFRCYFLKGKDYLIKCPSQRWLWLRVTNFQRLNWHQHYLLLMHAQ